MWTEQPVCAQVVFALVNQPMLELLGMLDRSGFSCWIFSGGGTDFMRTWASGVYRLPPYRVIGSVGETEFRLGPAGPELIKGNAVQVINDAPEAWAAARTGLARQPPTRSGP